jgi:hypothetical protein
MAKFAEFSIGELQALWSCTLGSARSVSNARKRSLGDWVFLDSRVPLSTADHSCAKERRYRCGVAGE